MYNAGELVVCGNNGVCEVVNIETIDLEGIDPNKKYYRLRMIYANNNEVFIPVDQNKVVIRPVMNKEQAQKLLEEMDSFEKIEVPIEKKREEYYKDVMRFHTCEAWIRILKTVYERKIEREATGKKITSTDDRYMRKAEDNLYLELSIALECEKEDAKTLIMDKIS